MKTDVRRNLQLLAFSVLIAFVAIALAALARQAQPTKVQPVVPPAVVTPEPPAPPPQPDATGTEAATTTPAIPLHLSPELKSADGVTSVVLRLPINDTFASGTWQTRSLTALDMYGTSTAFESQISWQLADGNGRELAKGYMMLASPDVGIPGPYDVKARIPRMPSTDTGTLRVYEASAKDGTPIHEVKIPIKFLCSSDHCDIGVILFFQNAKKDPGMKDCSKVFAVTRKVFADGRPGTIETLSELLSGPTAFETSKGYGTAIPENVPPPTMISIDGKNYLDFSPSLQQGVAGSCRVTAIRAQLDGTISGSGEAMPISVNGDPATTLQP